MAALTVDPGGSDVTSFLPEIPCLSNRDGTAFF